MDLGFLIFSTKIIEKHQQTLKRIQNVQLLNWNREDCNNIKKRWIKLHKPLNTKGKQSRRDL